MYLEIIEEKFLNPLILQHVCNLDVNGFFSKLHSHNELFVFFESQLSQLVDIKLSK
jgi:hypothetical protein